MRQEVLPIGPTDAVTPQKSRRLIHVDALRGLLLVFMGVNHVPSSLQVVTNHFFGFVSGAEGFVFLSGLMCGLVYSKRYYKFGVSEMKDAALRRASAVYLYHVATFVAVLAGLNLFAKITGAVPPSATPLVIAHPFVSLVSGLVFMQQPSLFDILPMYCAFLVILPWIIMACAKDDGKGVLIGSGLVWALAVAFSPQRPLIHGFVNTGSFNLLSWQILFVVGAVFGHAWATNRSLIAPPRRLPILIGASFAAVFFCVRHAWVHLPISGASLDWLTNKNNMAPLRLFDTALIFYLVYAWVSRTPHWFSWRPLAFLGRHSIFVFAAHILVAYAIQTFPDFFDSSALGRATSTVIMIGSLFLAAVIHDAWQKRAKQRAEELHARQNPPTPPTIGYGTRPIDAADSVRRGSR